MTCGHDSGRGATKAKPVGRYDLAEDRRPRFTSVTISVRFTGPRRFLGATRAHSCVHTRKLLGRMPTRTTVIRCPFDHSSAIPTAGTAVLLSQCQEKPAACFSGILHLESPFGQSQSSRQACRRKLRLDRFPLNHSLVDCARQ